MVLLATEVVAAEKVGDPSPPSPTLPLRPPMATLPPSVLPVTVTTLTFRGPNPEEL